MDLKNLANLLKRIIFEKEKKDDTKATCMFCGKSFDKIDMHEILMYNSFRPTDSWYACNSCIESKYPSGEGNWSSEAFDNRVRRELRK